MPWNFSQLGKIRAGGGQRLPPLFHYPAPGTVRHGVGRLTSLKIMALLRFDRYRPGDLLGWKSQWLARPVLTDFPSGFPPGQSRGKRAAGRDGSEGLEILVLQLRCSELIDGLGGRFPAGCPLAVCLGAYWFRPDGKRFRLRVVVGRLATLKVDQASIAEAQFSLAA
jgi:hypothetical protein